MKIVSAFCTLVFTLSLLASSVGTTQASLENGGMTYSTTIERMGITFDLEAIYPEEVNVDETYPMTINLTLKGIEKGRAEIDGTVIEPYPESITLKTVEVRVWTGWPVWVDNEVVVSWSSISSKEFSVDRTLTEDDVGVRVTVPVEIFVESFQPVHENYLENQRLSITLRMNLNPMPPEGKDVRVEYPRWGAFHQGEIGLEARELPIRVLGLKAMELPELPPTPKLEIIVDSEGGARCKFTQKAISKEALLFGRVMLESMARAMGISLEENLKQSIERSWGLEVEYVKFIWDEEKLEFGPEFKVSGFATREDNLWKTKQIKTEATGEGGEVEVLITFPEGSKITEIAEGMTVSGNTCTWRGSGPIPSVSYTYTPPPGLPLVVYVVPIVVVLVISLIVMRRRR